MTRPCVTSGELEKPHWGIFAPDSAAMALDHFRWPDTASRQLSVPAALSEYSRPSANVGVARGPGPLSTSEKRTGSSWDHISEPVAASRQTTASASPCCSWV